MRSSLSGRKQSVLFLCTGNSCRSQMAEALVNHYLGDEYTAFSAGIVPAGFVHPLALQVLREIGIDHKGICKSVSEFEGKDFDRVITVCAGADLNCPVWLGTGKKEHIGFTDPAQITGSEEERLDAFRQVRNEMMQRIVNYLRFTL